MKPEHDPLRFAALQHLRRHLVTVLDAVDMPETTRNTVVDALLQAGDVHCEDLPEIATVDRKPVPMVRHYAAVTIRYPWPDRIERTETEEPHHAAARLRTDEEQAALEAAR